MSQILRTVTRRLLIVSNTLVVILFLLACANAFLNPEHWWFLAILGLAFPFLLLGTFLFLIGWLLIRSRWAVLSLAALLIGFTNIRALIGVHFAAAEFSLPKKENTIRILTWNVAGFGGKIKSRKERDSVRRNMLAFIREQNADLLCFQEYFEPGPSFGYSNQRDIMNLQYPYYYKVGDYGRKGSYEVGVAIYSRYPLADTVRIRYPGPETSRAAESLLSCNVAVNGQVIRLFTTHLQSFLLQQKDYRDLEIIKKAEDSMLNASKSLVKKLKQGYIFRGDQVNLVRKQLDESPYPEIICGDFNDVPNSYTYFGIKGNRRDAFVERGRGLGRTFSAISPTLRIDYIMTDRQFDVVQYKRHLLPYSDHYPVVADLVLREATQ